MQSTSRLRAKNFFKTRHLAPFHAILGVIVKFNIHPIDRPFMPIIPLRAGSDAVKGLRLQSLSRTVFAHPIDVLKSMIEHMCSLVKLGNEETTIDPNSTSSGKLLVTFRAPTPPALRARHCAPARPSPRPQDACPPRTGTAPRWASGSPTTPAAAFATSSAGESYRGA